MQRTAEQTGLLSKTMKWTWDVPSNSHVFSEKSSLWRDFLGVSSVYSSSSPLVIEQSYAAVGAPGVLTTVGWESSPTLVWSKLSDPSEQLWTFQSTLTVPLPTSWVTAGSDFDLTLSVAILTDTKHPVGNYSEPTGLKVDTYGFTPTGNTKFSQPKSVKGFFVTTLAASLKTAISSVYPLPHVIISWQTTALGSQGSLYVDYDTLVYVGLSATAVRLTLKALR